MKLPNSPGIYQIHNKTNGRFYVGSAKNLRVRKNLHWSHLKGLKHHTAPLQNAWNKYGENAFEFQVVMVVPVVQLIWWEQRWVDCLRGSGHRLYNVKTKCDSCLGIKRTPEQIEASRQAGLARLPASAESRAKMSAAVKGYVKSPEHLAKLAAGRRGKRHSPETIQRFRETRKGRLFLTPEAIAARSRPYPDLIAPDGTFHAAGVRRADFCRTHGLAESGFNKLCRGEQKVHRGWRLFK